MLLCVPVLYWYAEHDFDELEHSHSKHLQTLVEPWLNYAVTSHTVKLEVFVLGMGLSLVPSGCAEVDENLEF